MGSIPNLATVSIFHLFYLAYPYLPGERVCYVGGLCHVMFKDLGKRINKLNKVNKIPFNNTNIRLHPRRIFKQNT